MKKFLLSLLALIAIAIGAKGQDMTATPLTIEAVEAGTIKIVNPNALTIEYNKNGEGWTTASSDPISITVAANDVVQFRGDNESYWASSMSGEAVTRFTATNPVYVYGNVMSLVHKDDFATNSTLTEEFALAYLFAAPTNDIYRFYDTNTTIRNHSTKNLVLPATSVPDTGYGYMFAGCQGLTRAPELPATTLAMGCYHQMFAECTGLTTAPALPATALSDMCYSNMFDGCSSLTTAPALPATTLAAGCYFGMFTNCSSLVNAPMLPATTLAEDCYHRMFEGCTSLQKAPTLPAPTLFGQVYGGMFDGCTSLNYVKCLATTIVDTSHGDDATTTAWLAGVAATGTFVKADEADWSVKTLTGAELNGIPEGWTVMNTSEEFDPYTEPLTFESLSSSLMINFYTKMNISGLQYRKYDASNDTWSDWQTISNGSVNNYVFVSGVGSKIQFKREDNSPLAIDYSTYSYFKNVSGNCYVYGNVMSLFNFETVLNDNYACYGLFDGNTGIRNHPTKDLVLGATTLSTSCYMRMFRKCTGLTRIPELPATTLAKNCYYEMFKGCTALNTTPVLPATTLAESCYYGMFMECTSLTTPPALPATILADGCYLLMFNDCTNLQTAPALPATVMTENCYAGMFEGCTSLQTTPELPATTLATACYHGMFEGCTGLTVAPALPATVMVDKCYKDMFSNCTNLQTAPALPSTSMAYWCYYRMFENCTSLTTAPVLPATTLAEGCYIWMFWGCTNLNYVKCLATDISADNCTLNWLNYVSPTGTFIKADGMENWEIGRNPDGENYGIPEGWTVGNASDYDSPLTFEAVEAGTIAVTKDDYSDLTGLNIQYKKNNGALTDVVWNENISLSAGDVISFHGSNGTCYNEENWSGFHIECSNNCYVYGNIMSIIDKDGFANNTTLTKTYAFYQLFQKSDFTANTTILNHPTKDLVLPATTLTINCYDAMFYDCQGLTRAPALPATAMADWCYNAMFKGCTNLAAAPQLPATDLAEFCYMEMFSGCTNIAEAPKLPATTLANSCYADMFMGCTSLTKAPDLPAETLVEACYIDMFAGCTNLNYVKCLATDISADYCTINWLDGVAATGTFKKATGMEDWTTGVDGIPTSWTVQNANTLSYIVPALGIGTYSNDVAFTLPEGLTAYYCKTYDTANSTISVVKIDGAVPANTGVLLKGTPGETYILTTTTETPAEISDNALVAVVSATHVEPTSGLYTNFMMTNGSFVKIQAASAETKMPANRAYLQILTADLPTGSTSRTITLNWGDETTGIASMEDGRSKMKDVNDTWYTLDGRRMMSKPTQKGVYIYGGHKVVIK